MIDTPRALELLNRAMDRRKALLADERTTCCRLVNSTGDGIEGFVLERFDDVLIAQLHEGRIAVRDDVAYALCHAAMERLGSKCVYRKVFPRDRSSSKVEAATRNNDRQPWIGEPAAEEFAVLENGATWHIRPHDGFSVGLFLENRENRKLVRSLAEGCDVLNGFAYTCGFAICAALGGARSTVNVDVSKKYLEWGKRNYAANGLALDGHWFIASDVIDYYRRAERQARSFDLIVLDAPTFGRVKETGRVFSLKDDLDRMLIGAIPLLRPGGRLLLAINHRQTSLERLQAALERAATGRRVFFEDVPSLAIDFAGDEDFAKTVIARIE